MCQILFKIIKQIMSFHLNIYFVFICQYLRTVIFDFRVISRPSRICCTLPRTKRHLWKVRRLTVWISNTQTHTHAHRQKHTQTLCPRALSSPLFGHPQNNNPSFVKNRLKLMLTCCHSLQGFGLNKTKANFYINTLLFITLYFS